MKVNPRSRACCGVPDGNPNITIVLLSITNAVPGVEPVKTTTTALGTAMRRARERLASIHHGEHVALNAPPQHKEESGSTRKGRRCLSRCQLLAHGKRNEFNDRLKAHHDTVWKINVFGDKLGAHHPLCLGESISGAHFLLLEVSEQPHDARNAFASNSLYGPLHFV